MSMELIVSQIAEKEFDEAIAWYADISPALAERFTLAVRLAFEKILAHPERFNFSRAGTRRFKLKPFPYDIHYVIGDKMINVIAVFHERKNSDAINKRPL